MMFPDSVWRAILCVLAIIGFAVAAYLRSKKHKEHGVVCPFRTKCDTVIQSGHAKFMGVPVEMLGMLYYGVLAASYATLAFVPEAATPLFLFVLLLATTGALFFSLYLVAIQAFVIRAWCAWCLLSAFVSLSIFALTLLTSDFGLVHLLAEYKAFFVILHALSAAIGVGAASITDVFFFKFLKDYRISEDEADTMKTLSQVIWFALGALVLTGLCLYLPEAARLNETPKFLLKTLIVLVLIGNGVVLNLLIQPKLVHISFGEPHHHMKGELHHLRKLSFALGAISIISWYTVFILGSLRSVALSFSQLSVIYLSILLIGIIGSQVFEYRVSNKQL